MTFNLGFWNLRTAAPLLVLLHTFGSVCVSFPPQEGGPPPPKAAAPHEAVVAESSGSVTPGVTQVQELLASLTRFDQEGRNPEQKLGFQLPEKYVNEYLAYALHKNPRPGVSAVTVKLLPQNSVTATVEVDFDAVQNWNAEMIPEMLRPLLHGKLSVPLNAGFESRNGTITFNFKDSMGPGGSVIPRKMLTALLQAIGTRQPEAYNVEHPIELPFGVKRVWTERQLICGET